MMKFWSGGLGNGHSSAYNIQGKEDGMKSDGIKHS